MPTRDPITEHLEKLRKSIPPAPKPIKACAPVKGRKLVLEKRRQNKTEEEKGIIAGGMIAATPILSDDYWNYRVVLSNSQALIGFEKFGTIGIGFAIEEDWNTNLPYTSDAKRIFDHIKHNKHDPSIPDNDVIKAIKMIQEAVNEDRPVRHFLLFKVKGSKPKEFVVGKSYLKDMKSAIEARKYWVKNKSKLPFTFTSIKIVAEPQKRWMENMEKYTFKDMK